MVSWLFPERLARRPRVFACVLGVLLAAPSLSMGFMLDDFPQLLTLEGRSPNGGAWDYFTTAPGDEAQNRALIRIGFHPWWTHPKLKLSLFRPLTAALANLDFSLFGRVAWPYHVNSLMWFAGLIAACATLYRRLVGPQVAAAAAMLFALDDVNWAPAVWIANRNALVAALPAVLGLAAHLRWREENWRPGLPLSLLGLSVGLLGSEVAVGVSAYWIAYELLGGPGGLKERIRALIPVAMVGGLYILVYRLRGHGTWGSAIYTDPLTSPGRFAANASGRLMALVGSYFSGVPADPWAAVQSFRPTQVALGVVTILLMLWLVRALWPQFDVAERRAVPWLSLGAFLSILPVLGTMPSTRLLLGAAVGGSVVLAILIRHSSVHTTRALRFASVVLVVIHVLLAGLTWPLQDILYKKIMEQMEHMALSPVFDEPGMEERTAVILTAADPTPAFYLRSIRAHFRRRVPKHVHVLTYAPLGVRVFRAAPNELELTFEGGAMLDSLFEQHVRAPDLPLEPGTRVELEGAAVIVRSAIEGKPTRLAVVFDRALEDQLLLFLRWEAGQFQRVVLPSVGGELRLPRSAGLLGEIAQ